jgi:hypothetical protein
MSELLPCVRSVSEAWLLSLERTAEAPGGRAVHVISTVTDPGAEIEAVRSVLDDALKTAGAQSVETVAETIFPASIYPDPGADWSPGLPTGERDRLDRAAEALYTAYSDMLPLLLTANGNHSGTYFSRMISWPGKGPGGFNQLAARIERLRGENAAGKRTHNALDMDLGADALADDPNEDGDDLRGIQVYAVTDKRTRAFPCLTHIDLTLHQGQLHAMAVYRHQYLIDKAYGNLLGLSWLMHFLCQQSGFDVGELVVHATFADAQVRSRALSLCREARAAFESDELVTNGRRR